MRRVVVQRVDAHGLLPGGVGGKLRVTQGVIVNVQYSIDEYICAACVTTHSHGCIHRACVLSSHLFWTSGLWMYQPGSHRRKVTQEEGHTGFLHLPSAMLALIFHHEKDSAVPFPRRPRSRTLWTNELIVLLYLTVFFLFSF